MATVRKVSDDRWMVHLSPSVSEIVVELNLPVEEAEAIRIGTGERNVGAGVLKILMNWLETDDEPDSRPAQT